MAFWEGILINQALKTKSDKVLSLELDAASGISDPCSDVGSWGHVTYVWGYSLEALRGAQPF